MHRVVNQYNAFELNEYNGKYEIVNGNVDDKGKFWIDWNIASEYNSEIGGSVPVKKDDGSYRNTPAKVLLGDKDQAIENLKWLLAQLVGSSMQEPDSGQPDSEEPPLGDDAPF